MRVRGRRAMPSRFHKILLVDTVASENAIDDENAAHGHGIPGRGGKDGFRSPNQPSAQQHVHQAHEHSKIFDNGKHGGNK